MMTDSTVAVQHSVFPPLFPLPAATCQPSACSPNWLETQGKPAPARETFFRIRPEAKCHSASPSYPGPNALGGFSALTAPPYHTSKPARRDRAAGGWICTCHEPSSKSQYSKEGVSARDRGHLCEYEPPNHFQLKTQLWWFSDSAPPAKAHALGGRRGVYLRPLDVRKWGWPLPSGALASRQVPVLSLWEIRDFGDSQRTKGLARSVSPSISGHSQCHEPGRNSRRGLEAPPVRIITAQRPNVSASPPCVESRSNYSDAYQRMNVWMATSSMNGVTRTL